MNKRDDSNQQDREKLVEILVLINKLHMETNPNKSRMMSIKENVQLCIKSIDYELTGN